MRHRFLGIAFFLAACHPNAPINNPLATSAETQVDPNSVAGDFKGVTGTHIRLTDFKSDLVSDREVEIWLPASYDDDLTKRYPVLYMHDGQNVFDPSQSNYSGWDWGVDEALTALKIDAIVVAPHSVDTTRDHDYMPEKGAIAYADNFRAEYPEFNPDELNADNYLTYLTAELKPYIDANYRTLAAPEHTSIMGSSMGGLISIYAISEHPDVFGSAAMVSTHFPIGQGSLVDYFAERLPSPATHRLYFDYGTQTLDHNYEGFQTRMDQAVETAGYRRGENWTTRKYKGHDHSERAWRNRIHVPLQFLLSQKKVHGGEEK